MVYTAGVTKPISHHIVRFYIALAILLVPWILYLAITLPQRHVVHNWDLAWVGFDIILLVAVVLTALMAYRASRWVVLVSAVTTGLLFADTWFDVVTSRAGFELSWSLVLGLAIQLPLAIVSLLIAITTLDRLIARSKPD